KVLGVNAHVLVLKYSTDFREYRDVMDKVSRAPGVIGVGPFIINPMMVSHGDKTATGVLLKGVDPERMGQVLDLPRHVKQGSLEGWRRPGATPPPKSGDSTPGLIPIPPAPDAPPSALSPKPPVPPKPVGSQDSLQDGPGRNESLLRSLREAMAD